MLVVIEFFIFNVVDLVELVSVKWYLKRILFLNCFVLDNVMYGFGCFVVVLGLM